jgi:predicted kinase
VATLIHLNGAPGVGKSTIAERYVADHPGVLACDIDRLRCLVGGWAEDFVGTGALVRPVALAMIRAHLDGGHDVVLPQLLASEPERDRFAGAAVEGGHAYLHLLLQAPGGVPAARFYDRPVDPLHAVVRGVVDADGGRPSIGAVAERLERAKAATGAVVIDAGLDVEATYRAMLAAVRDARRQPGLAPRPRG